MEIFLFYKSTVYPIYYAHGFSVLCYEIVLLQFFMYFFFTYIYIAISTVETRRLCDCLISPMNFLYIMGMFMLNLIRYSVKIQ